ncbi:MAG: hypothetical protein EBS53_03820, partial [Bacteroidetes bacterium]|nr:hypothetical protein [Bacteroidota bacterium]
MVNETITPTDAMHQWLQEREIRQFLEALHQFGEAGRQALLNNRSRLQERFDAGYRPTPLPETQDIRSGSWRVTDIPLDLRDRRVEITGPPERKMIVNALNSGAQVFMADFEDACSPSWGNICAGQYYLWQAVRRQIDFRDEERGKAYVLNERTATLMVRPRGWHLNERHINIQGKPMSATLFDTGLYLFLNAQTLIDQGSGPYLYLPKIENHQEAAYWASVLDYMVRYLRLPEGILKVTVLIETITAAFEMEEILYALRHYIVGMNAGRWDYLFSIIKNRISLCNIYKSTSTNNLIYTTLQESLTNNVCPIYKHLQKLFVKLTIKLHFVLENFLLNCRGRIILLNG